MSVNFGVHRTVKKPVIDKTISILIGISVFLTGCNSNFAVSDYVIPDANVMKVTEAPQIKKFSLSTPTVIEGSSVRVNFEVLGATSIKINPGDVSVSGSGSYTFRPTSNTTYTLTATNSIGSNSRSVTVTVEKASDEKGLCTQPLTVSERGKVKFHPGHYVAIGQTYDVDERLTATLSEIKDPSLSAIVGVQKRYAWSELHGPGINDFDFTTVLEDIAEAEGAGKKLSIMIMWKFLAAGRKDPVPAFLKDLTAGSGKPYEYALNADGDHANGFIANLGHPVVARQLIRFLSKLAAAVDQKNTVSSLVFAESAMGLNKDNFNPPMSASDFKDLQDAYVDGLLHVGQQSTCLFKHTPVIQFTNGPLRRLEEIATIQYPKWSISMGGPDVWINDRGQELVYEFYRLVENRLPIGIIVAGGNYLYESHDGELLPIGERGPVMLEGPESKYKWDANKVVIELARKGREELKANYLFWKKNGAAGDKFYTAFKEEIAKTGKAAQTIAPLDSSCPTNYGANCVVNLPVP